MSVQPVVQVREVGGEKKSTRRRRELILYRVIRERGYTKKVQHRRSLLEV